MKALCSLAFIVGSLFFTLNQALATDCLKATIVDGKVKLRKVTRKGACTGRQVEFLTGAVRAKQRIDLAAEYPLTTFDGTYHNVTGNLGTIVKISENSSLRVTLNAHAELINDADATASCIFQVRLNGLDSRGESTTSIESGTEAVAFINGNNFVNNDAISNSLSAVGYFDGLPAGDYQASVWLSGFSISSCILNKGGFAPYILVEEIG